MQTPQNKPENNPQKHNMPPNTNSDNPPIFLKNSSPNDPFDRVTAISQRFGKGLAVGLKGLKEDIEQIYNILFNYGGINGDLHTIGENFSYVIITQHNLKRGIANYRVTKKQTELIKEGKSKNSDPDSFQDIWKNAEAFADSFIERMEREEFLTSHPNLFISNPNEHLYKAHSDKAYKIKAEDSVDSEECFLHE